VRQEPAEGLAFKGNDGGRFTDVKTAWHALLDDAWIVGFHWHDLRHTFASKLVQAGEGLVVVQALLGHSDPRLTMVYAHPAPLSSPRP
jgi:hypothetical protein